MSNPLIYVKAWFAKDRFGTKCLIMVLYTADEMVDEWINEMISIANECYSSWWNDRDMKRLYFVV